MYARRLSCKHKEIGIRLHNREFSHAPRNQISSCRDREFRGGLIRKLISDWFLLSDVAYHNRCATSGYNTLNWKHSALRLYSSKSDGSNPSEDKDVPVKDAANSDKGKTRREKVKVGVTRVDAHARLGEQDQKEWLKNEKLSIESKRKDSPFLCKRERFKNEFLRRMVPWEKITVSWDTFPYHIHEHTKNLLVDCVASHLKHKKFTVSYGARLTSSSGRILLQSSPGTELYRERLVRALAQDLQVPLLVLDSSVLAPYDLGDESESESENAESGEECTSESEVEDENDASNEEWSGSEAKSESEDEVPSAAEALKKLVPYSLDDFAKRVSEEAESTSKSDASDASQSQEQSKRPLKRGDRVKYIGESTQVEADNRIILGRIPTSAGPTNAFTKIRSRSLPNGQRGEVYEVNGDHVAVVLDCEDKKKIEAEADKKSTDEAATSSIYWINIQNIEHDLDAQAEDCYIAMEALFEILPSLEPIIVYFPDTSQWLSRAVPKSKRKDFINKMEEMFNRLSGPVVLICGQNKVEGSSKEKEKFTMVLPNLGRLAKLPLSLKTLTEGFKPAKKSHDNEIYKLFTNVMSIQPPKDEELLRTFNKQVEEDRRIVISRSNLNEIHKVRKLLI
ncbi:p-loop containing nucleoside triphosphate hydrolases superfamily protein [Thalictrum thalictroides]|uniref:p-loop containing nucleoside triphosphate hydrolases superfamily protein n=1 Tax=Thalictrum thalictroides TaxID=46969 RepID=A0A7J6WYJ7_THATH|nr:p-loop containing nucleoside triphosphate hydrolases superfamily protein [Thalictrum thalictroides]